MSTLRRITQLLLNLPTMLEYWLHSLLLRAFSAVVGFFHPRLILFFKLYNIRKIPCTPPIRLPLQLT
jgi:hypothetical protein